MAVPIRVISKRVGNRRRPHDLWLKAVTAVGTTLLIFVTFGQLVMFYWQLRLLNRSTNGAGAATVVDMNDFAERVSRVGGLLRHPLALPPMRG
jgi:hypothetical protein